MNFHKIQQRVTRTLLLVVFALAGCQQAGSGTNAPLEPTAPPAASHTPAATSLPTKTPPPTATGTPTSTPTPEIQYISGYALAEDGQLVSETGAVLTLGDGVQFQEDDGRWIVRDADGNQVGYLETNPSGESLLAITPDTIIPPQAYQIPVDIQATVITSTEAITTPASISWPVEQTRIVDGVVEMYAPGIDGADAVIYRFNPDTKELTQYFWSREDLGFGADLQQWVDEQGNPIRGPLPHKMTEFENDEAYYDKYTLTGNVVSVTQLPISEGGDFFVQFAVPADAAGEHFVLVPLHFDFGGGEYTAFFADHVLRYGRRIFFDHTLDMMNQEFIPTLTPGTPLAVQIQVSKDPRQYLTHLFASNYAARIMSDINQYIHYYHGPEESCNSVDTCLPYFIEQDRVTGVLMPEDLVSLLEYLQRGGSYPLDMVPEDVHCMAVGLPQPENK